MSKVRVKLLIWVMLGGVLVTAGLGLIRAVSSLIAYFNENADAASVLNIVPNVPVDLAVGFEWLNEQPKTGREMEPATLELIQGQYMRGWLQWNISYLKGRPIGLSTYFNDAAFDAVTQSVVDAVEEGWMMTQTDLEHHIELHFYSADGSILSFTDHDVLVAEILRNGDGSPITTRTVKADYDVVMMLIDGNWKVRHWTRKNAEIIDPTNLAPPQGGQGFVELNGRALTLDGKPFTIRGINYYPQDSPWSLFWAQYDPDVVETDFQIISDLGMNSVRVFVPYAWPDPPHDEAKASADDGHGATVGEADPAAVQAYMRDNLRHLLDSAAAHDLKVIVTLFDFRTDYQILVWPDADRQVEALVPHFADHPAILAWDIKNEPDFDREGNTPEMVDLWLGHIAYQIREHDPNHLLTIGWAEIENAPLLSDVVDFVSFHYYGPADELASKMAALQTAVSDKPIALTEFGLPTLNSPFLPHGHTSSEQARYYADVRHALSQVENAGYMAWTLYDFTQMPSGVGGGPAQKHLGIIDRAGNLKPAAFYLSPDAPLNPPPHSVLDPVLKPFYATVLMLLVGAVLTAIFTIRQFCSGFAEWLVLPLRVWVVAPLRLARRPARRLLRAAWKRLWQIFGIGWRLIRKAAGWGMLPCCTAWRLFRAVLHWGAWLLMQIRPFAILIERLNARRHQLTARVVQKLDAFKTQLEAEAAHASEPK